jgi:signal transduction histidine kinase
MAALKNRLKNLFVASVSHEIRTPLNAILGSMQPLQREGYGHERQQAHLARIQNSGTHLKRVIDDLLDMSRIEAGRLAVTPTTATVGRTLEAALAEVEQSASEKGVHLSNAISGAAAELPYWGDDTWVRQILVNLLSNAIKFTPPQGRITVSGGTADTLVHGEENRNGPWVYVRVEDSGIGIPPERLTTIFEPFDGYTERCRSS